MKLIQVVEDEHGHAEVLKMLIQAKGYKVQVASNGSSALEQIRASIPDLVLTDFMMPIMNGAELGAALRQAPELQRVPIVMLSGTSREVVDRLFADYDAFVVKPYEVRDLLSVITELAEGGRNGREPEPTPP